jgi:hypothetical protein
MEAASRGQIWSYIGTKNGIICMCNDRFGLNILLHKPVTDELLEVQTRPPTHRYSRKTWHHTYGFAHDQTTGHYMAVHVSPNSFG